MRSCLVFLSLLAAAGILRFVHLEAGLPQGRDPDSVIVSQAVGLETSRNGGRGKVSNLYPVVLAHALDAVPGRLQNYAGPDASLEEHLAAARWPDQLGRMLVALLSLLALPAVWGLARKWSSPFGAAVACAFLGTALVHVVFSRMARPHGPVTALGVLSVLALCWSLRNPTWPRVLLTCAVVGLCIGTLHSGVAVLVPCFIATLWMLRRHGWRVAPRLLLGMAVTLGICWWAYPFADTAGLFSNRDMESPMTGGGFLRIIPRLLAADPVLVLAAVAGGLLALRRWGGQALPATSEGKDRSVELSHREARDAAWLCVAHALPYFLMIGLYRYSWLRFTMILVPYLALLAALPFEALCRAQRPRLAGALALGCLALPTYASARYVSVQGRPDIHTLAGLALQEHSKQRENTVIGAAVALPLPLNMGAMGNLQRDIRSPWHRYQQRHRPQWTRPPLRTFPLASRSDKRMRFPASDMEAVVRERRPHWAIVHLHDRSAEVPDMGLEVVLAHGGELVKAWGPYGEQGTADEMEDFENRLLLHALRLQRRGVSTGLFRMIPSLARGATAQR